MRNVSDTGYRENQCPQFVINTSVFENGAFCELVWGGVGIVEPDTSQTTICRMYIACWIPRATNTHSVYAIFNAFPL